MIIIIIMWEATVIDMVYHMNNAIYTAENYIISKSKIFILKYLVFIKLHYY